MTTTTLFTTISCPQCATEIVYHRNYVGWCLACNWNLEPSPSPEVLGQRARLYRFVGNKVGDQLFQSMARLSDFRPYWNGSKILALGIASIAYVLMFAIFAAGVFLLLTGWPQIFPTLFGVILLMVCWVIRPRIPKAPEYVISRDQAPALYALVDEINTSLHGRPIAGIQIDGDFNAFYTRAGVVQRPYVSFGLPLLAILEPQEVVALVAHELGHGVNGDILRTFYVKTAFEAVLSLAWLVRPTRLFPSSQQDLEQFVITILAFPVNLILFGLSKVLEWWATALLFLVYRDHQRSEYYADFLAARVAGTQHQMSMLRKLYLSDSYKVVRLRFKNYARNQKLDLFDDMRERAAVMPEHEYERIRRIHEKQGSRLHVTHPPTTYRMAFLEQHALNPMVTLQPNQYMAIEDELRRLCPKIQQQLIHS